MKKLGLLLTLAAMMCVGCTATKRETKTIYHTYTITDKYTRQVLDNFATWFWDVPQMKTLCYFNLNLYGEKEVSGADYNKYNIGDEYTWSEVIYV